MNYRKIYDNIIKRSSYAKKDGYYEIHHIIPRSLGGRDEENNLVKLTPREHFICHALLAKMYEKYSFEWYKMNHAFLMMKCESQFNKRYFNSYLYEYFRQNFSKVMQELQLGEKNSQYGKIWIFNLKTKSCKKILNVEELPKDWLIGRIINWEKYEQKNLKIIQKQQANKTKLFEKQKKAEMILDVYEKEGFESLADMLRNGHFTEFEYPARLTGYLKRYALERYKGLMTPGYSNKTYKPKK